MSERLNFDNVQQEIRELSQDLANMQIARRALVHYRDSIIMYDTPENMLEKELIKEMIDNIDSQEAVIRGG